MLRSLSVLGLSLLLISCGGPGQDGEPTPSRRGDPPGKSAPPGDGPPAPADARPTADPDRPPGDPMRPPGDDRPQPRDPASTGTWPGEGSATTDIGSECLGHVDCAYGVCLRIQDGYCSRAGCDTSGCPAGTSCRLFGEPPDQTAFCVDNCTTDADCRQHQNYVCDAEHTCWPAPAPSWNASVGAADCAAWWGNLSPCDTTPDDYVVVHKSARNVALCGHGGSNVANFHGALGFSPFGDKVQQGDGKTPEGVFYIAQRVSPSRFYKAFLISYPDAADAARGVAAGLLSASEQRRINAAQASCSIPPQTTNLGGAIEIHGASQTGAYDWSLGCIAVENGQVDRMGSALGVGDTIVIVP